MLVTQTGVILQSYIQRLKTWHDSNLILIEPQRFYPAIDWQFDLFFVPDYLVIHTDLDLTVSQLDSCLDSYLNFLLSRLLFFAHNQASLL